MMTIPGDGDGERAKPKDQYVVLINVGLPIVWEQNSLPPPLPSRSHPNSLTSHPPNSFSSQLVDLDNSQPPLPRHRHPVLYEFRSHAVHNMFIRTT